LEPPPHFPSQRKPWRCPYSVLGVGLRPVRGYPSASSATRCEPDHHGLAGSIATDRVGGTILPDDRRQPPALRARCRADGSSAGDLASARLENPRAISPTQSGDRTPPCSVKWRRKSLVINESHPQSVELGLGRRQDRGGGDHLPPCV